MTPVEQITSLYIGYFGRAPDPEGLNYWVGRLADGYTLAEAAESFSVQAESTAKYPYLANPNIASPQAFITQVYMNLFNRVPDAEGLAYWTAELQSGADVGDFILNVISGAVTDPDATIVANKVEVGVDFALDAAGVAGFEYDADAATAAVEVIDGVDATEASVEAAKAETDAFISGAGENPGQDFALTSAIQATVGTSGNDNFIAGIEGGLGGQTLNPGDSINGGAGDSDTLNLFGTGNAGAFAGANITNVEIVNAQVGGGGATALNVSGNADVDQAWLVNGSAGANTVTLTKAQTAGIQGNIGTTGADVATFAFSNASAATNDVANLSVNGARAGGVSIAAVETLNVNATGTNALGTLTAAALTTLNIAGAGSVSATAAAGGALATINAATNTGGINLDISAITASNLNITGSSANDTIRTAFGNQTAADVVNLGAGTNDTVVFTGGASILTAANAALIGGLAGVEELGTVDANLTVDGDLVSQTRFSTSGTGSLTITDAAQGSTAEFGAGAAGASTVAMKLGASTLNVELLGGSAAAADATAGLGVVGSSTVNVLSSGTAGVGANLLNLTVADNQSINITGSQALTLNVADTATTGVNVNGSAATGVLTITTGNDADIIVGGSAADVLSGGAGADILTGNGGNDTFGIATAAPATQAVLDVVNDFTAGDLLEFGDAAGSAVNYSEGAAAVADYAAALAAANTALAGPAIYNAQQVGANTFVFYDTDADGVADSAVQLSGVSLGQIDFNAIA